MSPRSSAQKRTPFKSARSTVPFERKCIECGKKLTKTFLYCAGGKCAEESKRKVRQKMGIGEYAKPRWRRTHSSRRASTSR